MTIKSKHGEFMSDALNKNELYKTPEEVLKVLFGYDSFRPGQKDIVDAILNYHPTKKY